jgi:transaldolase / glucose-6-phosphate isomerase
MNDYDTYLEGYQPAVAASLADLEKDDIPARIWRHDHTVWDPNPAEISNRLGWLHAPAEMAGQLAPIQELVAAVRVEGYSDVLLLGMGGSSLAPEVFSNVFGYDHDGLSLAILDSTDPGAVLAHARRLDPARTLFIVSTKSGGTVETLSGFKYFYNWTAQALGATMAGAHFVAITDPGSSLADLAARYQFRATFFNNPNVGGRYSALTYFGLVPAALVGVDPAELLARARAMRDHEAGIHLGATMGTLAKSGRDKVTFFTSPGLANFGDWIEQLVAESTGKAGTGILPVVGEAPGPPDVYGSDRWFAYLRLAQDDTHDAAVEALSQAGYPAVTFNLADRYDLGGQMFLWEMATAVAGHILGIQPFDQPNVEAAKKLARRMVEAYLASGRLPEGEVAPLTPAALDGFLAQARKGDYIALQAYAQPTAETEAAVQALRLALRARTGLATTVGFGPRYLHSTGQLHKGDGGGGLFIQFTADPVEDAPIPNTAGEPESDMSFGVLIKAQALGDGDALRQAGRRVIRFHLGKDVADGLRQLLDFVS